MSEQLRRERYRGDRVLIETERVLDPQFADGILYVTGASVEMLRNLVMYLHRRSTFVSEYRDVDYLTPTDEDWDSLEAAIADLEEKLMGNENVIWGYSEEWRESVDVAAVGGGDAVAQTSPVAAGYLQVLQGLVVKHTAVVGKDTQVFLYDGSNVLVLLSRQGTAVNEERQWFGEIVLAEGDVVTAYAFAPGDGKEIQLRVWGYKVKLPG